MARPYTRHMVVIAEPDVRGGANVLCQIRQEASYFSARALKREMAKQ